MTLQENEIESLVLETFNNLAEIEDNLFQIEQEQSEEELKLQHRFDLRRSDLYSRRNEIVKSIPGFWRIAIENHRFLKEIITEEVNRPREDHKTYEIKFVLLSNQYIENEIITKTLTSSSSHPPRVEVTNTLIRRKGVQKRKYSGDQEENAFVQGELEGGFFGVRGFLESNDQDSLDLANVLISDFYPNAVSYYQGESLSTGAVDEDLEDLDNEEEDDDDEEQEDSLSQQAHNNHDINGGSKTIGSSSMMKLLN